MCYMEKKVQSSRRRLFGNRNLGSLFGSCCFSKLHPGTLIATIITWIICLANCLVFCMVVAKQQHLDSISFTIICNVSTCFQQGMTSCPAKIFDIENVCGLFVQNSNFGMPRQLITFHKKISWSVLLNKFLYVWWSAVDCRKIFSHTASVALFSVGIFPSTSDCLTTLWKTCIFHPSTTDVFPPVHRRQHFFSAGHFFLTSDCQT